MSKVVAVQQFFELYGWNCEGTLGKAGTDIVGIQVRDQEDDQKQVQLVGQVFAIAKQLMQVRSHKVVCNTWKESLEDCKWERRKQAYFKDYLECLVEARYIRHLHFTMHDWYANGSGEVQNCVGSYISDELYHISPRHEMIACTYLIGNRTNR